MISTLLNAYFCLLGVFYVACVFFGTPTCLPTLARVYQFAKISIWSSSNHLPTNSPYQKFRRRLYHLRGVVMHILFFRPIFGFLHFLDNIILNWRSQRIVQPLIVTSAPRSGSTTLGHVLDMDDTLCGPPALFCTFPFLCVWMLVDATVGRFISSKQADAFVASKAPEEIRVRHELHPFKPDTLDVSVSLRQWWGVVFHIQLSRPEIVKESLFFWQLPKYEQERAINMVDEIGKKWLHWCEADETKQHLLLKSHQVGMVKALKKKYPDAAIITVHREPLHMCTSLIPFANYFGPRPRLPTAIDTPWLNYASMYYYTQYCQAELDLVSGDSPLMLGLPFMKLIKEQTSAMETIKHWIAKQWGTPPIAYAGSAHEAAVLQLEQDPEFAAEKAWRRSMKSKYPSQSVEKMQRIADEYAAANGLPKIDPDVAFKSYRQHIAKTQKSHIS